MVQSGAVELRHAAGAARLLQETQEKARQSQAQFGPSPVLSQHMVSCAVPTAATAPAASSTLQDLRMLMMIAHPVKSCLVSSSSQQRILLQQHLHLTCLHLAFLHLQQHLCMLLL